MPKLNDGLQMLLYLFILFQLNVIRGLDAFWHFVTVLLSVHWECLIALLLTDQYGPHNKRRPSTLCNSRYKFYFQKIQQFSSTLLLIQHA